MDALIAAAARALAAGDPLGALNGVALRNDAPALALRGIAMAQLGELVRAKALVRSAARAFGPNDAVARARCIVAEAEIALVARDLGWPAKALDAARATLEQHGDRVNAAHARHLEGRRLLLIGRLDEAERRLVGLDPASLPPALRAAHELAVAGIAMRRLRTKTARAALARAARAALRAGIPALVAEVESASVGLKTPAARLIARGEEGLPGSRKSKRCWHRERWSWTPVVMSCATRARWSRSQGVRCCSRSHVARRSVAQRHAAGHPHHARIPGEACR
jgi:tetratricopeptide (TPR) repeat protein